MFGDTSLFWLWFVLIIIILIIWAIFSCDDEKDEKHGRGHGRDEKWDLESAAEGSFLILSIPLLAYILFFILIGLFLLADRTWRGRWFWDLC